MYWLLLIIIPLLYLLAIRPSRKQRIAAAAFCKHAFAHRGLHGDVPENTLPAFIHAKEAGVGIELDVRLTKDKQVVVFHDDDLKRAAGINRRIDELTYDELQGIKLFDSEEHAPLLSEVLDAAGGVPLLVEIKAEFDCAELCEKTAHLLTGYAGAVAVESFSPIALRWFAVNRPEFLRGQLGSRFVYEGREKPFWQRFVVGNLLGNFFAKPDFLAYDVRHTKAFSFEVCRFVYRVPVVYWVVRGKREGIFEVRDGE